MSRAQKKTIRIPHQPIELTIPPGIEVKCKGYTGDFTYAPERILNGWDQNFASSNQIHTNSSGQKMIMILIEPGGSNDTVVFLFEDTGDYYREINENSAYATLRNHFYDHLAESLKEDFGIDRENVSMIIVPRDIYMFGILDQATLHSEEAAIEIIPNICEVSFVNSSPIAHANLYSAATSVIARRSSVSSTQGKKIGRDDAEGEKAESTRSTRSRRGGKRKKGKKTRRKITKKRKTMRRKKMRKG